MAYQAEYIWLDGTQPTPLLRSKTKILKDEVTKPPIATALSHIARQSRVSWRVFDDEDLPILASHPRQPAISGQMARCFAPRLVVERRRGDDLFLRFHARLGFRMPGTLNPVLPAGLPYPLGDVVPEVILA